jgi:tRNA nucleotidyltransferase (CCA-adding enzyme)
MTNASNHIGSSSVETMSRSYYNGHVRRRRPRTEVKHVNDHSIRRAREAIEVIAAKHDLTVERVVVYGSYARGDDEASDLDIVVVCPEWADEDDYYARPIPLLLEWPRGELPVPDIVSPLP